METFKRKKVGQIAVSDNQSSSVTLNELAKKAREIDSLLKFVNLQYFSLALFTRSYRVTDEA